MAIDYQLHQTPPKQTLAAYSFNSSAGNLGHTNIHTHAPDTTHTYMYLHAEITGINSEMHIGACIDLANM